MSNFVFKMHSEQLDRLTVDLHLSKALFSLDPDNIQMYCFLGLGALFCSSFFCPLNQPCKTLQMVQATPCLVPVDYSVRIPLSRGSSDGVLHIGENTSLPPMWPRCNSRTHLLWVEFVVGSLPATLVFLFSRNQHFQNASST